jgi:hypothetical protein
MDGNILFFSWWLLVAVIIVLVIKVTTKFINPRRLLPDTSEMISLVCATLVISVFATFVPWALLVGLIAVAANVLDISLRDIIPAQLLTFGSWLLIFICVSGWMLKDIVRSWFRSPGPKDGIDASERK